jgi:hypothetical protein
MPALFASSDQASLTAQRQYLWLRGTQLAALVVAAGFAVVPLPHYAAALAATAFTLAGFLEATILTLQPERTWYQGRALAESVKTVAWRWAVAAKPFTIDIDHPREALLRRLQQLLADFPQLSLLPPPQAGTYITPWMMATRNASLQERQACYKQHRIEDQRAWYAAKAQSNRRRWLFWSIAILLIQTVGVVSAIARAVDDRIIDVLVIAAAGAASVLAWLQIKQHAPLAEGYGVAALELARIEALISDEQSESEWSSFVDEAENAVSREHTTWRAKRS